MTETYDVWLDDRLGFMFERRDRLGRGDVTKPAIYQGVFAPAAETPVDIAYDSFQNGGGFSRRWLPQTYDRASNLHMRTPTIVLPAGLKTRVVLPAAIRDQGVPIAASAVLNGDVYIGAGRYIAVSIRGTSDFLIDAGGDLGGNFQVVSLEVFNGQLYAGGMNPATRQAAGLYRKGGTAWQQSANAPKKHLAGPVNWVRKTVNRDVMIGTRDQGAQTSYYQHIPLGADPMDEANWSAVIRVGRPEFPINSVVAAPKRVYFCKGEGIFDVDERDYTPNYTPWFKNTYEQTNGLHSVIVNGHIYVSHFQGLQRLPLNDRRQDTAQPCGPGTGSPTETPVFGAPTAMAVDGTGWIAQAYHDGQDAYVWYGRDRDEMGAQTPGPLVHHGSEADYLGQQISHLRITSVNGDPRLWTATQVNGAGGEVRLYRQSIALGQNPIQDYLWPSPTSRVASGYHEFEPEGALYLPTEDWEKAQALKILRKFRVVSENLNSSSTLDILASIDGGAYVAQLSANVSPFFSGIPLDDQQTARYVKLKIVGTGTPRRPFVMRSVEMAADVIVEQSEVIEIPIILAQYQPLGSNAPSSGDQDAIWNDIKDLVTRGPITVRCRGIRQEFRAKVLPLPGYRIIQDREGHDAYRVMTLRLSVVDPPMGFLIWDGSTPYDSVYGYES